MTEKNPETPSEVAFWNFQSKIWLKNLIVSTEAIANDLLTNWAHDLNTLIFWRGNSNYVYTFEFKAERFFCESLMKVKIPLVK